MIDIVEQHAQFMEQVLPEHRYFVSEIHNKLMESKCKAKYAVNKKGYVVSYIHRKTKMGILTFRSPKIKTTVNLLVMDASNYIDYINTLPQLMQEDIINSNNCGVIADPPGCNPNCRRGLKINLHGVNYVKCKYSCFGFEINDSSKLYIEHFIDMELANIEKQDG